MMFLETGLFFFICAVGWRMASWLEKQRPPVPRRPRPVVPVKPDPARIAAEKEYESWMNGGVD